jgi:hypothetical protein
MAKTAPYWLATGTHSLLTTGTINRMAAPVTFTPATAVSLAKMWPAEKIILPDYQIGNFLLSLSLLLKDK